MSKLSICFDLKYILWYFFSERSEIMNVSQTITNILNYYNENPNCDPNMFEYVGLCYDMVQYLSKEAPNYGIHSTNERTNEQAEKLYHIPKTIYYKFQLLAEQVGQKLLGNDLGITKDSPLYQLYQDLTFSVGTYSAYGDTPLRQKLGGVSLFIHQKKRDVEKGIIEEFKYDNQVEVEEIQRMNQKFHDPQSVGHYVTTENSKEPKYVVPKPSPRQQLIEEILNEYQKSPMTR